MENETPTLVHPHVGTLATVGHDKKFPEARGRGGTEERLGEDMTLTLVERIAKIETENDCAWTTGFEGQLRAMDGNFGTAFDTTAKLYARKEERDGIANRFEADETSKLVENLGDGERADLAMSFVGRNRNGGCDGVSCFGLKVAIDDILNNCA